MARCNNFNDSKVKDGGNDFMKTWLSWSSGKDAAWTLHRLKQMPGIELQGLFTTVNETFDRVAMHGVRRELLEAQALCAGLPLHVIHLPWPCSNEIYEKIMGAFIEKALAAGVEAMAFGDLFLEDVRDYRIKQLEGTGITPLFPLWHLPTKALARKMIAEGMRAHIACVDPNQIDARFSGRRFDLAFLEELPESADPCGENGEFHTFVDDGPMFAQPVAVKLGETVKRDGFVYTDVLPG